MSLFKILLTAFLLSISIYGQDSLYLVGTITGESTSEAITNVSGIGDVNGDGYDDFIVTHYFNKSADLYFGGASFDLEPDITFYYPDNGDSVRYFGIAAGIGDVNGDGYDDFTISGTFLNDGYFPKGKVFLYFGGTEIAGNPVNEFSGPWIEDGFGNTYKMGDLNKDGFDDFMICSPYNWTDGMGYAYLLWGGDNISFDNSLTLSTGNTEDNFGTCAANIGDLNKDGFDDIAISAIGDRSGTDTGRVYVYYGSLNMDKTYDTLITPEKWEFNFGKLLIPANDLDNNGNTNFFIGSSEGSILLYEKLELKKIINGYDFGSGGYINIESGFDLNSDKYNDFAIGNSNHLNPDSKMTGGMFVYLGTSALDLNYDYHVDGETKWSHYSKSMTHGDLNGDGFDELIVLADNFPDSDNPLGKLYIYSLIANTDCVSKDHFNPSEFNLLQNYPNPFNPATTINYHLSGPHQVTIKVFDILGKEITTLINEEKPAGSYSIKFNAEQYNLSSGIYFCELKINGGESKKIKMTLIK